MRTLLILLTALTLSATTAAAANLMVAPGGLPSALAKARGGDTILLGPGVYAGLALKDLTFSPGITITSADPAHPATFTNFEGHNIHGIKFANLEMLAKAPGYFVFGFADSSDLQFDHLNVHGSLDGDPTNDAEGIGVGKSSNISITNSEFQQLRRAIAINTTTGITLSGNNIHDVEMTGVVMAAVTDVKITRNTIHDLFPATGDHPDAIQFETAGQPLGSKKIEISGNLIFVGSGRPSQGIFFRDQGGKLPFEDVSIIGNLVVGTGYGGILVMGAKGLTVSGNELVSYPGSTNNTWILVQAADQVIASNNRAQNINFDDATNVTQKSNKTTSPVSDRGAEAMARWAAKPEFAPVVGPFAAPGAPH